jgi:mannitol-specific phosphotransferase system IIBC component
MSEINGRDVRKVIIACDAGMGSSVMVASQMRQRLKKYDVAVDHVPVNQIPADAQVVVCHAGLAQRARGIAPGAVVVPFQIFMGDPAFERVEAAIRDGGSLAD